MTTPNSAPDVLRSRAGGSTMSRDVAVRSWWSITSARMASLRPSARQTARARSIGALALFLLAMAVCVYAVTTHPYSDAELENYHDGPW